MKRVLSILLVAVMLFSILPTAAFAAEDETLLTVTSGEETAEITDESVPATETDDMSADISDDIEPAPADEPEGEPAPADEPEGEPVETADPAETVEQNTNDIPAPELEGQDHDFHVPGEAVEENFVAAYDDEAGHHCAVCEIAVYCEICGEELSREAVVLHSPAEPVEESRTEATVEAAGSYDSVIYCLDCGEEISRETVEIPALLSAFEGIRTIGDVTIKVSAPEGVFPYGASLSVSVPADTEAETAVDVAASASGEEAKAENCYVFDIKILAADGEELQPNTEYGSVTVEFVLPEAPQAGAEVIHVTDDGEFAADLLESVESGEAVVVETDTFSYYVIFTYGTSTPMEYSMQVGASVQLSRLLDELGITYTDITAAPASSDNSKLSVTGPDADGDYAIKAEEEFTESINLTVGLDGAEKIIAISCAETGDIHWNVFNNCLYISSEDHCQDNLDNKLIYTWDGEGETPWMNEAYRQNITAVKVEGRVQPVSVSGWFGSAEVSKALVNCKSFDLTGLDTSLVTDMSNMFSQCAALTTIDLSMLNTSNVTDMSRMFYYDRNLKGVNFGGIDTSSVTTVEWMFYACASLTNTNVVTGFDTSSVKYFTNMFSMCSNLIEADFGSFDFSSAEKLNSLLYGCQKLITVSFADDINTSNVTTMANMFSYCYELTAVDLSHFDVSKLTDSSYLFYLDGQLETVNMFTTPTDNLKTFRNMMTGCTSLTEIDLSAFVTTNSTVYANAFNDATSLTRVIVGDGWNTKSFSISPFEKWKATVGHNLAEVSYDSIPAGAEIWEAVEVPPIYWLVHNGTLYLTSDEQNLIDQLGVPAAGSFASNVLFNKEDEVPWSGLCGEITAVKAGAMSSGDVISPVYTRYWFNNCANLVNCDLAGLNTAKTADMGYMYCNCSSLPSDKAGLEHLNTSSVTTMDRMFQNCRSFSALDFTELPDFTTARVSNMIYMFDGCSGIEKLDISTWDTTKNTIHAYVMFRDCSSLADLRLPSDFLKNYTGDGSSMFKNCSSLVELDLSSMKGSSTSTWRQVFEGCSSLKKLDFSGITIVKGTNGAGTYASMFAGCVDLEEISIGEGWTLGSFPSVPNQIWLGSEDGNIYYSEEIPVGIAQTYTSCSEDIYSWKLDDSTGVLTVVKGASLYEAGNAFTGLVNGAKKEDPSWLRYAGSITSVTLDGSEGDIAPQFAYNWFKGLTNCASFDLSGMKLSRLISAEGMFQTCIKVRELTLPADESGNLRNTASMFAGCTALKSLDLGGLRTDKCSDMSRMFYNCQSLEVLDLSSVGFPCDLLSNTLYNTLRLKKLILSASACANISNVYLGMPKKSYLPGITDGVWYDTDSTPYTQTRDMQLAEPMTYAVGYTVTIDPNGGVYDKAGTPCSDVITVVVPYDLLIPAPAVTKTGYTFGGWVNTETNQPYDVATDPVKTTTSLKAVWTPDEYDIEYVFNVSDVTNSNPAVYTVEDLPVSFADAVKTGYTFEGWYSDSGCTAGYSAIPAGTTGKVTVYGKFTPNSYTVRYDANGGSGTLADQSFTFDVEQSLRTGTGVITPADPTTQVFIGWALTPTGAKVYDDGALVKNLTTEPDGVVTLYAYYQGVSQYEFIVEHYTEKLGDPGNYELANRDYRDAYEDDTVSKAATTPSPIAGQVNNICIDELYRSYEGFTAVADTNIPYTVTAPNDSLVIKLYYNRQSYSLTVVADTGTELDASCTLSGSYPYGTQIDLKANELTGYVWGGWTSSDTTLQPGTDGRTISFTMPAGTLTMTAKADKDTYDIIYELDGGALASGDSNPAKYTVTDSFTLKNPSKTGYEFTGWTGTDLSDKTVTVTVPTDSTGDRAYTANYSPIQYTINYHLSADATNDPANPLVYDITYGQIDFNEPDRPGYIFGGWFDNDALSGTEVKSLPAGTTGNINLYPAWTVADYTITWHDNGADSNPNSSYISYNINSPAYTVEDAEKENYDFLGWYDKEVGGNKVTEIPAGTTGDLEFWARYKAKAFTISYDMNGTGLVNTPVPASGNKTSYTTEDVTFFVYNPTCKGYTFLGWTGTGITGDPVKTLSIPTGSSGNREYIANWKATPYNITYVLDGGTNADSNPASYTIEDQVTLADPVKSGYAFDGWYEDSSFSTPATGIALGSTGEKTFYAKFTQKFADVTVHHYLKGTTTKVAEDVKVNLAVNAEYTAEPVTVYQGKNLTVDSYDPTQKVTVSEEGNVITIYYTLPLTITAVTDGQLYDGTPLAGSYKLDGNLDSDESIIRTAIGTAPSITNVLESRNYQADTAGIPGYYVVTNNSGKLTIIPRIVTLTSATDEKEYDGTPLTNNKVEVGGDGFASGEGATFSVTGTITLPGAVENIFTYTLNAGSDASNYAISPKNGTLTVTNRDTKYEITVVAKSNTVTYDGTEHEAKGFETLTFTVNGQTYTVSGLTTEDPVQVNEGTYSNNITGTVVVQDSEGNDVTKQFTVHTSNGSLVINKRAITITANGGSKEYDGSPITAEATGYTITSGSLATGDTANVTLSGSRLLPGTETAAVSAVKIMNGNTEVTGNYTITPMTGTLTVNNRSAKYEITLVAVSNTGNTYDGTAYEAKGVVTDKFTFDGVEYTVSGFTTSDPKEINAGTYPNTINSSGYVVTDPSGNDVSGQFMVTPQNGTLEIAKREITVQAIGGSKEYDGSPITAEETGYTITSGSLAAGDTASVTLKGSRLLPGTETAAVSTVKIMNGNTEVTGNYTITPLPGTLTVNNRSAKYEITLVAVSNTGNTYDGVAYEAKGVVTDKFTFDGVEYTVSGFTTSDPKEINAGTYPNTITSTGYVVTDPSGNDVSGEFMVTPQNGTLEIAKREITIQANGGSKEYDGTAITAEETGYTITSGSLAAGDIAVVTLSGSRTLPGTATAEVIGVTILGSTKAKGGNDKTGNYNIVTDSGILEIKNRTEKYEITLVAASNTGNTYDGTAYEAKGVVTHKFTFDGVEYTVSGFTTSDPSEINAGTYLNTITSTGYVVTDPSGNDVSSQFAVTPQNGTLEIAKREITIQANGGSKQYDGSPITAEETGYTITNGSLAAGDTATVTLTGEIKLPGTVPAVVENVAVMNGTTEVTGNYEITMVNGALTVESEYGSLTIKKTVTGDEGDKTKYFTFTVVFNAEGSYSYTGSKSGTVKSGDSIMLKHGESITIEGLPAGITYSVTESGNTGYRVYVSGDTGTIPANGNSTAAFTNAKSKVPVTGDTTNLSLWLGITGMSGFGMLLTALLGGKRRKKHNPVK